MNKCTKCGSEIPENIKFCVSCGVKLNNSNRTDKCRKCGSVTPSGANFCVVCGSPISEPACSSNNNLVGKTVCSPGMNFEGNNGNSGSGGKVYLNNMAPVFQKSYDTPAGLYKKKQGRKKLWVISALVVIVCFSVFLFRDSISNIFDSIGIWNKSSEMSEFISDGIDVGLGELNPAPMPFSGSKPFEFSPDEGLTISAGENALDQDRTFTAYRLNDEELNNIAGGFPYGDMAVIDGYEVDAGLETDEYFPGMVKMEFDMEKLNIPDNMRKYMGVVRIGEDGQSEILSSSVEGSKLVCFTNKNSVIVTALLLGGLAAVSGYFVYDDMGEKNLWKFPQYKGKKFYKTNLIKGYSIYWPEGMDFHNPDAVKSKVDELNKVFAKHKIPVDKGIAEGIISSVKNENYKDYRESVRTVLGGVFSDKEFIKLFNEVSSIEWQKSNVWPTEVKVSIEALENADKYLFDIRKFRKPAHDVEVGILPSWPYDNKDVVGYSFNPKLGSTYIHINAEYPGIPWRKEHLENPQLLKRYQPGLDELNITIAHELFHVAQSGYVPVDWSSYVWFWEATAILLENEAAKYYLDEEIIKDAGSTTDRNYFETFTNTLGHSEHWNHMDNSESLIRHQAYTASWFLQFLRDRYYSGNKDDFLKNILIRFGYQKDYVKALREQTSDNEEVFCSDFKLFCAQNSEKIRKRVSDVTKNSKEQFFGLTVGSYYRLDMKKPYNEIKVEYNPLSTNIKFLDINYDEGVYAAEDVCLVFMMSEDDIQTGGDMLVRFDQDKGRSMKSVNKDKVSKVENIENLSGNIQEIHAYMEIEGENSEKRYDILMMVKPGKPNIEIRDNKLVITLPQKSALFAAGYVERYLLTITDPNGKTIMLETDKDMLELELSNTGDFTDWDSPEMKREISEAARKFIESNPQLKGELYGSADKDTVDEAIDSIGDMEIDYGVMNRAAEILNEAASGQGIEKKYIVTVSEITKGEKHVYGPPSDPAELEAKMSSTGGVNIYGAWEGKVQMTGQKVTATIEQGKDQYDYTLKLSMYEDIEFYGNDNGDGTCTFGEGQGFMFTLIKNSENELYMTAPPVTLRRK